MKSKLSVLLTSLLIIGALTTTIAVMRAQDCPAPNPTAAAGHTVGPKHPNAEKHPALQRAISALQEAKVHLQRADHDLGGHRKQAIEDIDKALAPLKLALQFDKQ